MELYKIWLFCLGLVQTFLMIHSKLCKNDNYVFYRSLALKGDGSSLKLNATRSDFLAEYGGCNADEHALKMVDFFESYGFDLGDASTNPFSYRSEENYELALTSGIGNFRIVMASIFDYTSFENSPVDTAWWSLTTKTDVNTPKGLIVEGSMLWFGLYRIFMHGRYFCLYYKSNTPALETPSGLVPFDLLFESPEWGSGRSRGMYAVFPDFTFDNREFITFPGDNPKYKTN